jgi:hypothetical protein
MPTLNRTGAVLFHHGSAIGVVGVCSRILARLLARRCHNSAQFRRIVATYFRGAHKLFGPGVVRLARWKRP